MCRFLDRHQFIAILVDEKKADVNATNEVHREHVESRYIYCKYLHTSVQIYISIWIFM